MYVAVHKDCMIVHIHTNYANISSIYNIILGTFVDTQHKMFWAGKMSAFLYSPKIYKWFKSKLT
jgi:hypothetical protein